MQTVPFGKLGFEVSRFGMGCMRLPLQSSRDSSQVDAEESIRMIRYAVEQRVLARSSI